MPSASEGVDFASLDGEKVHLFFLLISPPDRPGDHLRALENISRQLRDDTFCRFLKQAKTAEEIWQLLDEADNNQFGSRALMACSANSICAPWSWPIRGIARPYRPICSSSRQTDFSKSWRLSKDDERSTARSILSYPDAGRRAGNGAGDSRRTGRTPRRPSMPWPSCWHRAFPKEIA